MRRAAITIALLSLLSARARADQPPEGAAGAPPETPTAVAADAKSLGVWQLPHWDKGFVRVSTPTGAGGMPFRLVLNHVSQFKYTNSLATNETYTDHTGLVHDVQRRNDIQLTRDVFYFSGYAFDTRLDYNILVFTSTATLVATAAGYADGRTYQPGDQILPRLRFAARHLAAALHRTLSA
jgi:hypothetical protein